MLVRMVFAPQTFSHPKAGFATQLELNLKNKQTKKNNPQNKNENVYFGSLEKFDLILIIWGLLIRIKCINCGCGNVIYLLLLIALQGVLPSGISKEKCQISLLLHLERR